MALVLAFALASPAAHAQGFRAKIDGARDGDSVSGIAVWDDVPNATSYIVTISYSWRDEYGQIHTQPIDTFPWYGPAVDFSYDLPGAIAISISVEAYGDDGYIGNASHVDRQL